MIAIDTSALMAIVGREPLASACHGKLMSEEKLLISAGTLAEALVVAARRNVDREMDRLTRDLEWEVVPVTQASATGVAAAYAAWGKGVHAAKLNLGDCFAYEVAKRYNCPLLYIGADFAMTDIVSAL